MFCLGAKNDKALVAYYETGIFPKTELGLRRILGLDALNLNRARSYRPRPISGVGPG